MKWKRRKSEHILQLKNHKRADTDLLSKSFSSQNQRETLEYNSKMRIREKFLLYWKNSATKIWGFQAFSLKRNPPLQKLWKISRFRSSLWVPISNYNKFVMKNTKSNDQNLFIKSEETVLKTLQNWLKCFQEMVRLLKNRICLAKQFKGPKKQL